MDEIKDFWQQSKADYESRYNSTFLTDYNKSLPYFEKMQELLLDMQKEDKNNVDVACLLASVRMELRESYDTCGELYLIFLMRIKTAYLTVTRQEYTQTSDITLILSPLLLSIYLKLKSWILNIMKLMKV